MPKQNNIPGFTTIVTLLIFALSIQGCAYLKSTDEEKEYPRQGSRSSQFVEGPHLIYADDHVSILNSHEVAGQMTLHTLKTTRKDLKTLGVIKSGFLPRNFQVVLKDTIKGEPSYFEAPDSLFAVSDIEGNFNTLINLLQQNHIIDDQLNWQFGSGHFVFIGDIFDRGNHVTEMLWFLYGLEAQAHQQNGYVHVLLGNHEIFNLRGDLRYLEKKYVDFATLTKNKFDLTHRDLFSDQSELGRWLRSKNIIEKIGARIFVHAGLSPDLVNSGYSIAEINQISRKTLDTPKAEYGDDAKLIWGKYGPVWYRGYFDVNRESWGPKASQDDVDLALRHFNADQIIVGHTHVEKPELRYEGKVCAINVAPPADHLVYAPPLRSFGILITGSAIFRADDNGELVEL